MIPKHLERKSVFTANSLPVILLMLSVGIIGLFTYDAYYLLTAKKDELHALSTEKAELWKALSELGDLKVRSAVPAFAEEISRYVAPYREDTVLESLFVKAPGIFVLSVGMSKGGKLPNGLSMADVSVTLRAASQTSLLKYLETLTGITGKKRYIIKQATFPFNSSGIQEGTFQVNLSLGMYHFSK